MIIQTKVLRSIFIARNIYDIPKESNKISITSFTAVLRKIDCEYQNKYVFTYQKYSNHNNDGDYIIKLLLFTNVYSVPLHFY